ncbi:MAG TPA: phage protease [Longimicrobium sp.]|jgi:phage I-like protein
MTDAYARLSAHTSAGSLGTAAHSTVLDLTDDGLPDWVHLLPIGTFSGIDGRGPYHMPDAEAVVRITKERARGRDLPIDVGHALELPGHAGDAAPASGWISEVEARDDGIWGKVMWTASGDAKIRGREFRMLSPVFLHAPDGYVIAILRAGLTNRPNLDLVSINAQHGGAAAGQEDTVAVPKSIPTALGLAETAAEAEIVARCSSAVQAQAGLARVATHLQLPATATADEVITAVNSATAAAADPAKFVPIEQYQQLSTALHSAQTREGTRLVDRLITDGKLIPAKREWALSYHTRDPQGFATFADGLPKIIQEDAGGGGGGGGGTGGAAKLTAAELAVCSALQQSPEEFIKNRES